ncbi:MAG: hypothetical protein L3J79_07360, partial [Candidatus Marinimicrobia bacterium]|nr:hypothetical protein [Candidatus Neomarinimicrobiota bacterium]
MKSISDISKARSILQFLLITVLFSHSLLAQENAASSDPEPDSLATIEVGFSGSTDTDIDYEALVKELYGEEAKKDPVAITKVEPIKGRSRGQQVGSAPGLMQNSFLNGAHFALNASSPFAVSDPLFSWYSFIDGSLTFKIPYELYVESLPLYILFEVS